MRESNVPTGYVVVCLVLVSFVVGALTAGWSVYGPTEGLTDRINAETTGEGGK